MNLNMKVLENEMDLSDSIGKLISDLEDLQALPD